MLLRIFRSNQPYTALFFVPVSLALWLPMLLWAKDPADSLYRISLLFGGGTANPVVSFGIAAGLSSLNASLLNRLFNRHEYMNRSNYLPGLFYLLYASTSTGEDTVFPILLSHTMLIPGLSRLSAVFREPRALAPYFECGFWIGLGAIFYPPTILIVIACLVAIGYTRPFNLREFVMPLAGALVPAIYYVSYRFITGNSLFPEILLRAESPLSGTEYSKSGIIMLLLALLVFLVSAGSMLGTFNRSTNKSRNTKAVALIWSTGIILSSWFFVREGVGSLASFCALPAALVFPYFFFSERPSGQWKELPFVLLGLSVLSYLWHWY